MEELKKGEKFGYLKIKERVVGGYKCICKCKKVVIVRSNDLTAGKVKSCGCYKSEKMKEDIRLGKTISHHRSNNTSGYPGVCYDNYHKKWKAYIMIDGKRISLGSYEDKNDAIIAREQAENELCWNV